MNNYESQVKYEEILAKSIIHNRLNVSSKKD